MEYKYQILVLGHTRAHYLGQRPDYGKIDLCVWIINAHKIGPSIQMIKVGISHWKQEESESPAVCCVLDEESLYDLLFGDLR